LQVNSIWYWCTDQVMVQRVLAAKSASAGQSGCVMAGWLKITPMFLMVLPGLIAAALYPEEIKENSDMAFALLVARLLPGGWKGPMVAVMLSSFMAALASCFNSCSTLFTIDIYAKWQPDHTEAELVKVGRAFTIFVAVVSVLWLPMISASSSELFLYIQGMQVIWCGPIALVFLASVSMKSLSADTAWAVLMIGLVFGAFYWLLSTGLPAAWRWPPLESLNILYFSMISFTFSAALMAALHLIEHIRGNSADERTALLTKGAVLDHPIEQQIWAGLPTKISAALLCVTVAGLIVALPMA